MDRTLQSGLEKRTRMGVWQTRVYRLERGFLSAWPDVASAAGNAEPSRVECLFEDKQVAVVADHGIEKAESRCGTKCSASDKHFPKNFSPFSGFDLSSRKTRRTVLS